MSTTISDGTTTLTPILVDGYESKRESMTIVHTIIGSPEPAVTLRPASMRSGTLSVVVGASRSLALQFEAMLGAGRVCTIADTTVDVAMSFVVVDELTVALDDTTRSVWVVSFDFQEVAP